jgi:hypothetical protein
LDVGCVKKVLAPVVAEQNTWSEDEEVPRRTGRFDCYLSVDSTAGEHVQVGAPFELGLDTLSGAKDEDETTFVPPSSNGSSRASDEENIGSSKRPIVVESASTSLWRPATG